MVCVSVFFDVSVSAVVKVKVLNQLIGAFNEYTFVSLSPRNCGVSEYFRDSVLRRYTILKKFSLRQRMRRF